MTGGGTLSYSEFGTRLMQAGDGARVPLAGSFELTGCGASEGDARRFHGAFLTFVRDVMQEAPRRSTAGSAPE